MPPSPQLVFVVLVRHCGHGHGEETQAVQVTRSLSEALGTARSARALGYRPVDGDMFAGIMALSEGEIVMRPSHSGGTCYPFVYVRRPHPFNQGEVPPGWTEQFFRGGKTLDENFDITEEEAFRTFAGGEGEEIPPEPR